MFIVFCFVLVYSLCSTFARRKDQNIVKIDDKNNDKPHIRW